MKSAMPKFVLNYKHVDVVAIIPVKNPEVGGKMAVAMRHESPGAKVKKTHHWDWAVIAKLHQSQEAPTENKIGFVIPDALLGENGKPRKDIIFQMNVFERGGRRLARGAHNFAQVICNSRGERLSPLSLDFHREDCGPRVLFANHDLVAVTANDDDYVSISKLSLQTESKMIHVVKEELRSALNYRDPMFPMGFYDAAIAAIERARCKGCEKPHFCKRWINTEYSQRKKREFLKAKKLAKNRN